MEKILEALIKVVDEKGHIRFLKKDDVEIKIKGTEEPKVAKEPQKEKKPFLKKFNKK